MSYYRIAILASLLFLHGQYSIFASTTGLPFLKLGVGAHAQAMGSAYMAQSKDASATAWNPASIAELKSQDIYIYRTQHIENAAYNYLAYTHSLKNGKSGLGVSLGSYTKGTFEGRGENREKLNDFSAADRFAAMAYALRVSPKVSVGANIKGISSNIESHSALGFAVDFSGNYRWSDRTQVAVGFFNVGPSLNYSGSEVSLPSQFSIGLAHQAWGLVTLTADSRTELFTQKSQMSLGGELNMGSLASLRMGYLSSLAKSGRNSGETGSVIGNSGGFATGVGFSLMQSIKLNYAFVSIGELGGTHHIDLNWRFGK